MMFLTLNSGVVLAALVVSAFAGNSYNLSDCISGKGFYSAFGFDDIPDPTHGRVNYVDEATAQGLNLTYATDDTFIMRADDVAVLSSNGPGRDSIRIRSNQAYTTHVAVFDMVHMPQGCGLFGRQTSPSGQTGEADIVEGVNDVGPNQSTLHTGANCSIPASGVKQLGTTISTNCDSETDNTGCGVQHTQDLHSFGPAFNDIGGGWYAIERTDHHINIWFWERGDISAPNDATTGALSVDTGKWGIPAVHFPSTDCDLATHFDANYIIINLTFCGDWAGAAYAKSGCPSDCVDYVNNNPTAFSDAYFQFNSIHIYELPGGSHRASID